MTSTGFTSDDNPGKPPPRQRGAPKGHRNAWKHGERSATARQARAASRARIVALLPDASVVADSLLSANFVHARLAGTIENAPQSPNKTNNSVAEDARRGEGGARFSSNKTNNSAACPRERLRNVEFDCFRP